MKRLAEYLLLAVLVIFLTVKGILPAWHDVHSDFTNYYVSARLVADGAPLEYLYDEAWFQDKMIAYGIEPQGKFSPFPPITAWIALPLTPFNVLTAQRIFLIINLTFLLVGIWTLKKVTGWEIRHCALLILGSGLGIANNFAFGQIYWIMTVLLLFSMVLFFNNRQVVAGIIIGIFTAIKYFPAVLIFGFLLVTMRNNPSRKAGDSRVVVSSIATLLILIVAQFLFFGNQVMREFFNNAFLPHLDGQLSGQGLYAFQYQSWDNLFRNLFVADPEFNPSPWVDWPNGKTLMKLLVMTIVAGSATFCLYHYRNAGLKIRRSIFLSIPALAALLVLPASATYHFVLLLIPLALLLRQDVLGKKIIQPVIVLYTLMGFIPYSFAFELGKSAGLIFAYPRLWLISALYVIVIASLLKERKLKTVSWE